MAEALCVSLDGLVIYANQQVAELFGLQGPSALIGKRLADAAAPSAAGQMAALVEAAQANPGATVEDHIILRDGRSVDLEARAQPLDLAAGRAYCLILRDVSERRAFEDQLTRQAFLDPLTGLANRTLFMVRLDHAVIRADRHGRSLAVLFLDLDDFKLINDSLGHDIGDLLLVEVARRLRAALRQEDTLARLGGDEFTALLEDVSDPEDAGRVADRIRRRLQQPIQIRGRHLNVSCSVGITLRPPGGPAPAELLRQADIAMYRAKQGGKARYAVFKPDMGAHARRRLALHTDLRRAVEAGELTLHYQPVRSLPGGGIDSVEALLRWQHPERGLLYPSEFLPVAEEAGLMIPAGRWVLEEACRQARRWHDAFPAAAPLRVSVNLSARQLRLPELVEEVERALSVSKLPPACLHLEVSERIVDSEDPSLSEVLQGLKATGATLVLDDFGSAHGALGSLKNLPIDVVKVDTRSIGFAGGAYDGLGLLRYLIALARALDLRVICEGVETAEQAEAIQELGCDGIQGFAVAHPLPPADLEPLLLADLGLHSTGETA